MPAAGAVVPQEPNRRRTVILFCNFVSPGKWTFPGRSWGLRLRLAPAAVAFTYRDWPYSQYYSVVLPPRVPALAAPEEPDLRFIGGTELAQPPEGRVVAALRAGDLQGGKGCDLLLVLDDGDGPPSPGLCRFGRIVVREITEKTALPALELAARRDHEAPALGAEHPLQSMSPEGLTLGMGAPATFYHRGGPAGILRWGNPFFPERPMLSE